MKMFLLFIMVCGMFAGTFAQPGIAARNMPESADKWVINKVYLKTLTGKLFVDLPKGTAWDITIYAAGSDKVISNTALKTTFTLPPGSYDLEINHIWIKGVPVEKGNYTRLKAGVLRITSYGSGMLYDETKATVLITFESPQTRGLPVGKYILTTMGRDQAIEIKDGAAGQENIIAIESDNWILTPLESIPDGKGRLYVKLPGNYSVTNPLTNETIVIPDLTKCEIVIASYSNPPISDTFKSGKNLAPGFYSARLNRVLIKNVPIEKGKVTRLKAGFLIIHLNDIGNPYCHFYSYNENDEMIKVFEYQFHGGKYALPPGKYFLSIYNNPEQDRYKITIKDGETVINGVKQY